ncbi:uncharacterized protein BX663DRAFT_562074 [Cokeromyces recurvatus]|uniref:uncharacterized protein n=1 Tax=Cokeromyces recurvatus TaxID=90255 RepID=UPI00221E4FF6|nr:uncharacterized protein BX663DRAFT_562074 [Cokeromyces recurvatus]KAI7901590.1 hypothetical protein BX663DRAFT_562074 [Cokeromyces recurvatus]
MAYSTSIAIEQTSKMTISERRATYSLQERIKIYNPNRMARKLKNQTPTKLVLHDIHILNKISIDSDTAMTTIKQRRETHNRNVLVNRLSGLVPRTAVEKKNNELRKRLGLPPRNNSSSVFSTESSEDYSDTPASSFIKGS